MRLKTVNDEDRDLGDLYFSPYLCQNKIITGRYRVVCMVVTIYYLAYELNNSSYHKSYQLNVGMHRLRALNKLHTTLAILCMIIVVVLWQRCYRNEQC